jgi:hypothetical protein
VRCRFHKVVSISANELLRTQQADAAMALEQ